MKTSRLLPLAAIALAALLSCTAHAKPNILVILADDLGYGELGCQGFTKEIPTPNIDSIAKNGVRFTSGYVSGPYCSPTRAGFMTGRYQQRFGHEFNPGPAEAAVKEFGLPLTEKTIGDRLKAAGYATGWFGKSHLGYEPQFHPLKRGFDEYYGFLGGARSYFDAAADRSPMLRGTEPAGKFEYTTDALAAETASFVERNKDKPWFAYLAFNAVHSPMEATEKYLSRFPNIADKKRRTYAAMQSALDDGVGLVLAKLREHKLEENTLVIFFTDNGGPTANNTSGNGPLRGFKSQTWEGGIRVPFMMQWKGKIPAGKVDDRPVIQLDIHPTALAAAGVGSDADTPVREAGSNADKSVRITPPLDGVNLLPYVTGEKSGAPHEPLYWRFGQQIALRSGDWKIVKGAGMDGIEGGRAGKADTAGAELYNLKDDIGEKTNLAEKNPEKLKELSALWDKWNAGNIEAAWGPGSRAKAAKPGDPTQPKRKRKQGN